MKHKKIRTPQGEVIYVPKEKNLYTKQGKAKDAEIWTCYQKTKSKRKVNIHLKTNPMIQSFKHIFFIELNRSKVFRSLPNFFRWQGPKRYGVHSDHANHQQLYADLIRRNLINNDIDTLVSKTPESVQNIYTRYIFNRHKAR